MLVVTELVVSGIQYTNIKSCALQYIGKKGGKLQKTHHAILIYRYTVPFRDHNKPSCFCYSDTTDYIPTRIFLPEKVNDTLC